MRLVRANQGSEERIPYNENQHHDQREFGIFILLPVSSI